MYRGNQRREATVVLAGFAIAFAMCFYCKRAQASFSSAEVEEKQASVAISLTQPVSQSVRQSVERGSAGCGSGGKRAIKFEKHQGGAN